MKRSEALRIIWEAINELEDADHILTRLEEVGMLPPKHNEYGFQVNEWEPENDDQRIDE